MKQIAYLGALKLAIYLKQNFAEDYAASYPHILPKETDPERVQEAEKLFYDRINGTPLELCIGNSVAETLVQLAFLLYLYPETARLFYAVSARNQCGITLEVAAKVSKEEFGEAQDDIYDAYRSLRKVFLWSNTERDITATPFYVDYTLAVFISNGMYVPEESLKKETEYYSAHSKKELPILFTEEYEKILDNWQEEFWFVQVSGEKESGRRSLIKNVAQHQRVSVLFVEADYLLANMEVEEKERRMHLLARDLYLLHSAVCICNLHMEAERKQQTTPTEVKRILEFVQEYREQSHALFLTTCENFYLFPFVHEKQLHVRTHRLTAKQSESAWEMLGRLHGIDINQTVLHTVAEQMILPVGVIDKVIVQPEFRDASLTEIFELCFQAIDDGRFEGISRVNSSFTMEDLMLEESQKNQIQEIIQAIRRQKVVFQNSSIRKLFPYGTSITALFSGCPGTGKTMAAHVIANEVHLPLFKINLSQVMDKYIGESEKKLEKIFTQAEGGNLILFFDEADALIGKRSEITDSKDRYANATVSYILQRMEELNGIVLMATNFSNNIDEAFMRRIQYAVNFTNPSPQIRRKLWESYLKDIDWEEIDFDILASEAYDFSPAILKNILIHAIFLLQEGERLSMKQIARSAVVEYQKMGRNGIPDIIKQDLEA